MKKFFVALTFLIAIATEVAIAQTQAQDQVARQQVARLADGTKDLAGGLIEEAKKRQKLESRIAEAEKAIEEKTAVPPVVKTTVSGLTLSAAKKVFVEIGGYSHTDILFFNLIVAGFSPEQAELEIKKYIALLEPGKVKVNQKPRRALIASWAEKAKSQNQDFAKKTVDQQIQLETAARCEADKNANEKIQAQSETQRNLEKNFNVFSSNYNNELKNRIEKNETDLDELRGDVFKLAEEVDSNAKSFENWKTATDATLDEFGFGIYSLAVGVQKLSQAQMYEEGKVVNKPFGSSVTAFFGRDKKVQKTETEFSQKARVADSLAGSIMAKYAKYRREPALAPEPEE